MRILHLVNDEKFIHFIADVFNSCEGVTNQFLVVVANPLLPLKHVNSLSNMRLIDKRYIKSGEIFEDLTHYDALIVHYLDFFKAKVLLKAPENLPIVWSGWGGDYHDLLPSKSNNLLGHKTEQLQTLLARNLALMQRLKARAKSILKPVLYDHVMDKAMRRIDYFSAPIPEDFDLIRKSINLDVKYKQINYGSVERTFMSGPKYVNGINILVGNSASATNNHLEIFHLLSKVDLKDRKVVVPLSYGDAAYRDAAIKYGRDLLGESFHPIVDFVPLEQYNTTIAECSVALMGHRRQQAVGNIVTMLYKGAKVFLDETTTTYQFLKKRGVSIHGLRELDNAEQSMFSALSEEQILNNREILGAIWNHDVVVNNTRSLIETLRTHLEITHAQG